MRSFTQSLKSVATVEAAGLALVELARGFRFTNLVIVDPAKAFEAPSSELVFVSRSMSDAQTFAKNRPLCENPVSRLCWQLGEPQSLTEMRHSLGMSEGDFWSLVPPWMHGTDALTANAHTGRSRQLSLMYWGQRGAVTGAMRSVLLIASRMACEHLGDLDNKPAAPAQLSAREEAALRLIAAGRTDEDAGQVLGITARTIRFHIDNAKIKLGVTTRAQAVLKILRGDLPC